MSVSDIESPLHVGLSAWIIQDGNYGDFEVGQEAKFALEFYSPQDLRTAHRGPAFADRITASRYRVQARVAFSGPQAWVIDTGRFMAFQQGEPPSHASVGTWMEGTIYLGVDPFFYFEELHRIAGMPLLSYRWVVRDVMREVTPWVEVKDQSGRATRKRDEGKEAFVSAAKTDAWHDDEGHGHYVLGLEQMAGPEGP